MRQEQEALHHNKFGEEPSLITKTMLAVCVSNQLIL